MRPSDPSEPDLLDVLARGLLDPVARIHTAGLLLVRQGEVLPADLRTDLLAEVYERCHEVSELLIELIRGGRPEVQAALRELQQP